MSPEKQEFWRVLAKIVKNRRVCEGDHTNPHWHRVDPLTGGVGGPQPQNPGPTPIPKPDVFD